MVAIVLGQVFKVIGASEKVVALMQYQPGIKTNGGIQIPDDQCSGELELRNVSFEYPTKKGA